MRNGFQQLAATVTGFFLAGQLMAQNPDSVATIGDDFQSTLKETTITVTPHAKLKNHFAINYAHACAHNEMRAHILVMDADSNGFLSQQHDQIIEAAYNYVTLENNMVRLEEDVRIDRYNDTGTRYFAVFNQAGSISKESYDYELSFDEGLAQLNTILMLNPGQKPNLVAKPE